MPFTHIFSENDKCKEYKCKINSQNIKKIFKPDNGFLDKAIEQKLFPSGSYKICDCIIVCEDSNLVLVEILCGKLTHREFKEKKEQLENCCKTVTHIGSTDKIKKIILLYNSLESSKKQPLLKKALLNPKVCGLPLVHSSDNTFNSSC